MSGRDGLLHCEDGLQSVGTASVDEEMLDAPVQNVTGELRDSVTTSAPLNQTGDERSDMFAGPADSEETTGAAEVSGPFLQPAVPSNQATASAQDSEMHTAMVLDPRVVEAAQVRALVSVLPMVSTSVGAVTADVGLGQLRCKGRVDWTGIEGGGHVIHTRPCGRLGKAWQSLCRVCGCGRPLQQHDHYQ